MEKLKWLNQELIKEKAHLTEKGIIKIKAIKSGMNTGRKD